MSNIETAVVVRKRRCPHPHCIHSRSAFTVGGLKNHFRRAHGQALTAFQVQMRVEASRRGMIKRHFGMEEHEHDGLLTHFLIKQRMRCAICGRRHNEDGVPLSLDHDHETGKARGALCIKCNTGLGQLGDTAESLRKALTYLERTA